MRDTDWIFGETAPLTVQLTDEANTALDPAAIILMIKPPGLPVILVNAPTRIKAGQYQHNLPLDRSGLWYYRWEATHGGLTSASEGLINVKPSRFRS